MSIKIIIDSSADISVEEAQKLGIEIIPMSISFGSEVYYDGVDILPNDFYRKLVKCSELPKTSQISPYRFEDRIKKFVDQGNEVLVITISSKLSNTYSRAVVACENFDGKAVAVDSLSAVAGVRLLCLYALDLIAKGYSLKDIANELNIIKEKIVIVAAVDTLDYLKKGGRISSAVAIAGGILSIKPILSVISGEVKMVGKARGSKNANKLIDKLANEQGEINYDLPYGFVYSGVSDEKLKNYLNMSSYKVENAPIYQIGSTIGTHTGPGAAGIVFFKK